MRDDRELWQRARPLFDELIELDNNARRVRLDAVGRDDPVLQEAVQRLINADTGSEVALSDYEFGSPRYTSKAANGLRDPLRIAGQTVSHFRVLNYLASGGMGVVYTAEDLQLGRTVALKFPLPDQHLDRMVKERFINEARSAAALDHPNLCTVHEIGDSEHGVFLAMPLYPGETLKDRIIREKSLPVTEALDIMTQVITGLVSAHAAGIVHRDLKPGNIMLLPGGAVKVLDFGLAKTGNVSLTKSRATLGTIRYIAPEQIRSGPVDARTDLWAIGVMLYEMITGRAPFRGEHEISVLHSILHEEPAAPSQLNDGLPSQFDDLVGALLQKNPGDRYQSAEALLADAVALKRGAPLALRTAFWRRTARRRRVRITLLPIAAVAVLAVIGGVSWNVYQRGSNSGAPAPAAVQTVAVLPFLNQSDNSADEYIASGITDEVTAILERTPAIRLAARSSAVALQRRGMVPQEVGRQLGVAHLVRGAIQVLSDTLRIAVKLTRVADDATLWTKDFKAPVSDAFIVEQGIANGVLGVLQPGVARAPSALPPTSDREAYELYLKGRYAYNQAPRTREFLEKALIFYRGALERDPRFALAYSSTAVAYVNMANFGYMPSGEALARAEVAADRALALDSALADAYAARGFALSARGRFAESEASLKRAIELNPNSQDAHHYFAIHMMMTGRLAEAKEETRKTLSIDPLSLPGNTMLGFELAAEGNLEAARTQLRRALQLSPGYPLALYSLGAVEAALGNNEAAREVLEQALADVPGFPGVRAALAHVYRRTGRAAEERRLVAKMRSSIVDERTRLNYALALALLGPADSAFAMLQTAQWDLPTLLDLRYSPLLQTFRLDPRYPRLLARSGLKP